MLYWGMLHQKAFPNISNRQNASSICAAVDPSKWLQTPTGETEVFDDDSISQNGWFPGAYMAGIACTYLLFDNASHFLVGH